MVKPASISKLLPRYLERLRALSKRKKPVSGLHSDFSDLDRFTGGLLPGELIVIVGPPSTGKTRLALNVALSAAVNRMLPTAIISLKLSSNRVVSRLIASMARVNKPKLRKGRLTAREWGRIDKAAETLARAPIFVDATPGLSPSELRQRILDLKDDRKLGLVIVDEHQRMRSEKQDGTRVPAARTISGALKELAMELDVPVVAVSPLSRRLARRRKDRMVLSDLFGSGVEHDADMIVSIFKREFYVWGRIRRLTHHETPARK